MPSNHSDFPIGYKLGNNTSTKTFFTTLLDTWSIWRQPRSSRQDGVLKVKGKKAMI